MLPEAPQRKKILVAIFQRGAADGLNIVVPHGEKDYYELRPTIAIRGRPKARHGCRHRSGRLLRPASVARAAEADLRRPAPGDRGRRRLARSDALAFRRAGLHGIGHAGSEGHQRRLDEPRAAAPGPGKVSPVRALALGAVLPRSLRGHNPALALQSLNDFQIRAAGASKASNRCTAAPDPTLHATGQETFEAMSMLQSIQKQSYTPANGANYPAAASATACGRSRSSSRRMSAWRWRSPISAAGTIT